MIPTAGEALLDRVVVLGQSRVNTYSRGTVPRRLRAEPPFPEKDPPCHGQHGSVGRGGTQNDQAHGEALVGTGC